MRLINTRTLQLERFVGNPPPYAILSHTWGKDEVSFQDFQTSRSRERMAGFSKIRATCRQAQKHGLDFAWVDTCCIDKTSSAELGEAINSMFKWYKNSSMCYALLEDVSSPNMGSPAPDTTCVGFRRSRWFTRGWTLQELIAPRRLSFYNNSWSKIAEKERIAKELAAITGIDAFVLDGSGPLQRVSIGRRMSWAAGRETTREEDVAYSLFGLFDINMPLIYGEGIRAFQRLQEQILQQSDDHTVFAWREPQSAQAPNRTRGLFAASPDEFWNFRDGTPNGSKSTGKESSPEDKLVRVWRSDLPEDPITTSSKGIHITSLIRDIRYPWAPRDLIILILNCSYNGDSSSSAGIYLQRQGNDRYARVRVSEVARIDAGLTKISASIYGLRSTADINDNYFEQPWTTSTRLFGELLEAKRAAEGDRWIRKHYEHALCLKRRFFKVKARFKTFSLSRILVMDRWGIWRSFPFVARLHSGDLLMTKQPNFKAMFMFESRNLDQSIVVFAEIRQIAERHDHSLRASLLSYDEATKCHNSLLQDGFSLSLGSTPIRSDFSENQEDHQVSRLSSESRISIRAAEIYGISVQSIETTRPVILWYLWHVLADSFVPQTLLILVIPFLVWSLMFLVINDSASKEGKDILQEGRTTEKNGTTKEDGTTEQEASMEPGDSAMQ